MKITTKVSILSVCLVPFSQYAAAGVVSYQPYVGVDAGLFKESELSVSSESAKENNDFSFNLNGGYEIIDTENPNITLGIEAEYRYLGKADSDEISVEGYGVSVNLVPKFYFPETKAFFNILVGAGFYKVKAAESYSDTSEDDTESGYQLGAGFGYEFSNRMTLSASYRYLRFDMDNFDIDNNSWILGLKYHF